MLQPVGQWSQNFVRLRWNFARTALDARTPEMMAVLISLLNNNNKVALACLRRTSNATETTDTSQDGQK